MRTVLTLSFLFVTGLTAQAQDKKYSSPEGKFAVTFPAGAKTKTETKDAGGIKLHFTTVENKGATYAVIYLDLPPEAKNAAPKDLIDGAVKGIVTQSGGKLIDSETKDDTFGPDKFHRRTMLIEKDKGKVRTVMILAGSRLYVLAAGGVGDVANGKDVTTFHNSFEISK